MLSTRWPRDSHAPRVSFRNITIPKVSLLRTIVDKIADSVVVVTSDGIVRFVNPAAEALFGLPRDELVGSVFAYPMRDSAIAIVGAKGKTLRGEMRVSAIEWGGEPAHVATIRDISGRERLHELERQVNAANRRSSLAQLSSSIAHEINNPTAFILANLAVMKDIITDFEALFAEVRLSKKLLDRYQVTQSLGDVRDMLEDNSLGLDRIRSFIRDLKALAHDTLERIEMVDVNELVMLGCELMVVRWGQDVDFMCILGDAPAIAADRSRLMQVVVNLLDNAFQAAGAAGSGRERAGQSSGQRGMVEITTSCAADSIKVTIRDKGCGIPEDQLRDIFEPRFMAQGGQRGMGMGLAIAAEIASRHGGRIEVESELGQGSAFCLVLPTHTGLMLSETSKRAAPGQVRGRVLVVADDSLVRERIHEMLDADHDVVDTTGARANEHVTSDSDYDAILCDLASSASEAVALQKSLSRQAPELAQRMVFFGAGDMPPRIKRFIETSRVMVLERPLTAAILREVIERMGT